MLHSFSKRGAKLQLNLSWAYQHRATRSSLLRTLYHVCCIACQESDRGISRYAGRLSTRFSFLFIGTMPFHLPRIIVFPWLLLHGKLSRSRLQASPQSRLCFLHLLASAQSPKSQPVWLNLSWGLPTFFIETRAIVHVTVSGQFSCLGSDLQATFGETWFSGVVGTWLGFTVLVQPVKSSIDVVPPSHPNMIPSHLNF